MFKKVAVILLTGIIVGACSPQANQDEPKRNTSTHKVTEPNRADTLLVTIIGACSQDMDDVLKSANAAIQKDGDNITADNQLLQDSIDNTEKVIECSNKNFGEDDISGVNKYVKTRSLFATAYLDLIRYEEYAQDYLEKEKASSLVQASQILETINKEWALIEPTLQEEKRN